MPRTWRSFAVAGGGIGAAILLFFALMLRKVPDDLLRTAERQVIKSVEELDADCGDGCAGLAILENDWPFALGVVELSDRGEFRDPRQLQMILAQADSVPTREDILLVVYVHGWNHDARPGDTDLACFTETLSAVSRLQTYQGIERRPIGIFVSWRGALYRSLWTNRALSFWDRRDAADRIGEGNALRTIGEELVSVARRLRSARPNSGLRVVLVGHSFGARMLWSALEASQERSLISELADAVVLLNPAMDASLVDRILAQPDHLLPPTLIMASEADRAVADLYPAAGAVESVLRRGRLTSAIGAGHRASNVTHSLQLSNEDSVPKPRRFDQGCPYSRADELGLLTLARDGTATGSDLANYTEFQAPRLGTAALVRLEQLPSKTAPSGAPFHVALVEEALIADHNDFWTPEILDLVVRFVNAIALSGPTTRAVPTSARDSLQP